jgi:hypothetical protein
MRGVATIVSVIGLLASSSPVLAEKLSDEERAVLQKIKLDPQKQRDAFNELAPKNIRPNPALAPARTIAARSKSAAPVPAANIDATAKQPDAITTLLKKNEGKSPENRQYSSCAGLNPYLRQDWKDIGIISGAQCTDSVDKAQGAQASYTTDRIANNRIASIHGTAALVYSSVTGDIPGQITPYETTFGAYTTVNKLTNSAKSRVKSNVDTLAYGGLFELGLKVPNSGTHYFRIRGGSVEDDLKNTTAANAAFEWLPVYAPLHIHTPMIEPFGLPTILRFDPDFVVLYDSAIGKNQFLAFNNRQESIRIGPQLALNIWPFPGATDFLSRFHGLIVYDWNYETHSRKELNWFSGSLTFNIDQAGHFGITGSYKRGRDEDTGASTNLYLLSLSGKI